MRLYMMEKISKAKKKDEEDVKGTLKKIYDNDNKSIPNYLLTGVGKEAVKRGLIGLPIAALTANPATTPLGIAGMGALGVYDTTRGTQKSLQALKGKHRDGKNMTDVRKGLQGIKGVTQGLGGLGTLGLALGTGLAAHKVKNLF